MAEAVVVSIAENIVTYLVPQALDKVGTPCGAKHELEALRNTVSTLQAVLGDAEERCYQNQNRQIQVWLEKLKDAFYEVQDVLEEFAIEATRGDLSSHNKMCKEVRTFFSSSNQCAFKLKMIYKVRAVRARIEAIKTDRGFHLDERLEREWRNREETHSFIREEDIKGREDDKKTVMKFLLDSNVQENVSILPIVGIGGLGKTALAKYVYGESKFDLKMWVCVSTNFDVKKVVKKMLACAKGEEPKEDTMELLQNNLRIEINGKKYLLVLDDVWDIEQDPWLNLKTLLVGGARGSKILVTTRLPSVENIMVTTPSYHLEGLSKSASLDLLMQMAGQKIEEIQDPDMLAIGKEIVRKCSGVPLVIRTVGHLLSSKKTGREWLRFKDDKLPEVSKSEDNIKSVLRLSYDHLPSHLKQCFALCSLFPKDYEIKKQTLIDLWMAVGFIQPSNGTQHLEDVAHEYFMDLLGSNFFQDLKKNPYMNEDTCKMHDLMHDLACIVAGSECWVASGDTKSLHERTRYLSHGFLSNYPGEIPISLFKGSALRTFLSIIPVFWGVEKIGHPSEMFSVIWGSKRRRSFKRLRRPSSEAYLRQLIQSVKRLRVLDMHSACIEKVPRSICKLKYLKYLDLSRNGALERLPNSITRLQNLQTLNLNGCFHLEELPRDIRKLVSLRNLYIHGCLKLWYVPCGLGQLSSLHRLTHFILPKYRTLAKDCCGLGELNGLNDIRGSLCIENLRTATNAAKESEAANLVGKQSLESLVLNYWAHFNTDDTEIGNGDEALLDGLRPHSNLLELRITYYKGESLPRWMTNNLSLPNLVELQLRDCLCKQFPQLGLTNLKRLIIKKMHFLECLPEECLKSLTSLEKLSIASCFKLTSLSPSTQHRSNLVNLTIHDRGELDICEDQSSNVLDFQGFQSLRSVKFKRLPKLASLPRWLVQASNLECLRISYCESLNDIPEQPFNHLKKLDIHHCPLLTSLPHGIRRLASLTDLVISDCLGARFMQRQKQQHHLGFPRT